MPTTIIDGYKFRFYSSDINEPPHIHVIRDKKWLPNVVIEEVAATGVRFVDNLLYILLSDGREVSLPVDQIEWLEWLAKSAPKQRANWSLEPGGYAIYWEDLDDGIEVNHILAMQSLA